MSRALNMLSRAVVLPSLFHAVNAHVGFLNNLVVRDTIPDECSLISLQVVICEDYLTEASRDAASCFCYDPLTTWIPDIIDDAIETCASYAYTASPQDYPFLEEISGVCNAVGDVRNEPAQITAPGVCTNLAAYFDGCASLNPGFFDLAASDQASCLCYESTTWIPATIDNAVSSCVSFFSSVTADDLYSAYSPYLGFCTAIGDVSQQASPLPPPVPPPVATTPTPAASPPPRPTTPTIAPPPTPTITSPATLRPTAVASTNIFTNPACSLISYALSYCNSASRGFSTMVSSEQAPCLCYSSTDWAPQTFDNAVSNCASFIETIQPSDYSDLLSVQGFCTQVGDVLAASVTAQATETATATATGTSTSTPSSDDSDDGGLGGGGGGFVIGNGESSSGLSSTTTRAVITRTTDAAAVSTAITTTTRASRAVRNSGFADWVLGMGAVFLGMIGMLVVL